MAEMEASSLNKTILIIVRCVFSITPVQPRVLKRLAAK